ncbi:MAG: hypothetical protein HY270_16635 [Deltaproteobacteria bacterium]|nr:hypothetical protein [Deltaproteobacteria bacterium]
MKRTIRYLLFAAASLHSAAALAMYTPNPAARWQEGHFYLAGDFQFIGDKDLSGGQINNIYGVYARPGFSVARNVVVYGRLGFQGADSVDTGFAGGFGVQGSWVFPRQKAWAIGGAFDYLHWSANIHHGGPDISWNEFQFTPAVSYRVPDLPELTPYFGILFDIVDGRDSLSQGDPVGLLLGSNYDPSSHVRLDAQVRVVTETAFSFSMAFVF